ncbi:alpha/beta hydrolase [Rubrivivax gelatinosus]|uniref:Hydrolase n=1 Tax=Rubrivivax gelatinosus (strain NBRC 100245 / IL144) TaxID=983917 RepID=I0HSG6_RUBGI|nr:alpha/beta hydrolase [Rubrivivax gelatinosus]BAL95953.1 hydrolase [Rubrivivax gelatinosus IL144]
MAGLLERIRRAERRPFHAMEPAAARAAYETAAEVLDLPRAPLARVENFTIPAADGTPLRARLYAPSHERLPPLLYLHGGGFVIGSLETHDSLCRQLARRSGGAVVALDYRLAPEHRFPTAVDDAWAAMAWLAANTATLGLDGARLAVGGDSAGGTLAAASAIHARDIGLPLALQLLVTPGTTAHADTASHKLFANGFLIDAATIAWFFDHYIDYHHRHDWRFAPLEAEDLEGVAPACLLLAECDPLVDEGIAYADRLRLHSVPVALEIARGMTHDFIKMGRALPDAHAALDAAAAALREAWNP